MSDPISPVSNSPDGQRNEGPGGYIGRYKLLQQIGEGGFGSVFEAEQDQPVKRRVALKIIKLGMDTRDVIARFEAERQALALMDHPHIARVFDAGATDSGRPYFVMELVKGESIASYCDKHKLAINDRLKLFEQVCQAVQHAHTKSIIHRDLKPGNVLVSTQNDQPFAKVIDFGIAKATSGRLTDKTIFTDQNLMIGTPLYMSPEQAAGSADIDTRTDIYSLGVLLYELLTGTTPVQSATLRFAAYQEMQRLICEVEPPRPSTRLAQSSTTLTGVAAQRRTDPGKLTSAVRGELDWIVMKALEKDRTRRYETANGLAQDVRRYLEGLPVLAAPPSGVYQVQKFVRRHKLMVGAGSMMAASLLLGITGFAWQARIAQQRAAELEQVAKFQAAMLAQVDPTEAGKLLSADFKARLEAALSKAGIPEGERAAQVQTFLGMWQQVSATDAASALIDSTILRPAVGAIDKQFKDQPKVDAALSQALADLYLGMGMYDDALPLQQRALTLRRRVLGENHPDTISSISNMGEVLHYQGKLAEVMPYYREALEKRRKVLGEENPDTLESIARIGAVLHDQGELDQAIPYYLDALEKRRRILGSDDPATLDSIGNLGRLLQEQGKPDQAEPYFKEALEKKRRILGEEHPETLIAIGNMGVLLRGMGKLVEAEPYYREALQKSRSVLGENHPDTLTWIGNMGVLLRTEGKLDEAAPFFQEALDKRREVLGDTHPNTLVSLINMGGLLQAQGKNAATLALLAPAEASIRSAFTGDNGFRLAKYLMFMGKARTGLKDLKTAETNLLEAHASYVLTPGPTASETSDCVQALVELYTAMHEAEPGNGFDAKAKIWLAKLQGEAAVTMAPQPASPAAETLAAAPQAVASVLEALSTQPVDALAGRLLTWPVPSGARFKPLQDYAAFDEGTSRHHSGIDIPAQLGTPIVAAGSGVVDVRLLPAVDDRSQCMGNVVTIDHGQAATLYAHLNSVDVKSGQDVVAGQKVGTIGNTTGLLPDGGLCQRVPTHLHFEVRDLAVSKDLSTWGHTPTLAGEMIPADHPDALGYRDPMLYFQPDIARMNPTQTATISNTGSGVTLRTGPDVSYRTTGQLTRVGEKFSASAQRGGSTSCDQGWLQVTKANYFNDLANPLATGTVKLPDVWLCKGNAGRTWANLG